MVYHPKVYIFRHGKNTISSNGIRISSYFAAGYRTAFCYLDEDCQEWKNSPTKKCNHIHHFTFLESFYSSILVKIPTSEYDFDL